MHVTDTAVAINGLAADFRVMQLPERQHHLRVNRVAKHLHKVHVTQNANVRPEPITAVDFITRRIAVSVGRRMLVIQQPQISARRRGNVITRIGFSRLGLLGDGQQAEQR